jgi:hypothetical protein
MTSITHLLGSTVSQGHIRFAQDGEVLVLQHSSGTLQKLLHWPVNGREVSVRDCASIKIMSRDFVELFPLAICNEIYMLVGIGFKYEQHT